MNRTDRLYALREELRRAGSAGRTAERLSRLFEVSIRTVKRDISALQQGGFPVYARSGPGGGYVVDAAATLPPVNFTDAEASGLAAAVTAHRGQPFDSHARAALAKVLSVMDAATQERTVALGSRIWIDQAESPGDVHVRRAIEQTLHERRVLSLSYLDDEVATYRIDPVLLAHTRGYWWVVRRCRTSAMGTGATKDADSTSGFVMNSGTGSSGLEELRWFRLDQIISAHPTAEPAADIPVAAVGTPPPTAASISRPDE